MSSKPSDGFRRAARALVWALCALPSLAAAQLPEYAVKAEFLERFTRFVDWPAGSSARDGSLPFVIGLYGTNPFGSYLDEAIAGRKIKGKSVEVRVVASPEDAARCDLLFIPAAERRTIPKILARTADQPVLTVSEVDGAAEKGVLLNFYFSESNLRFEVNEGAVRRSRLAFSSRLLKLARIVNPEESR